MPLPAEARELDEVNRAEQIGMRLAFDHTDTPEYYLFTARGEWIGQIAQFEPFGDVGAKIPLGSRTVSTAKGWRPGPMKTNPIMTKQQVDAAIAKSRTVFPGRSAMAGNKGPIFLSHNMAELHQMARGIGLGAWGAIAEFHQLASARAELAEPRMATR